MKMHTSKEMEIHDNSNVVMAPIIRPEIQKTTEMEAGNYFVPAAPSNGKLSTTSKVVAAIAGVLLVGFIVLTIILSV